MEKHLVLGLLLQAVSVLTTFRGIQSCLRCVWEMVVIALEEVRRTRDLQRLDWTKGCTVVVSVESM